MRIPNKAIEGVMKLRDQIINHDYPNSKPSLQNYRNYSIMLEYYNDLSHTVIITVWDNNHTAYIFTGIIDNDSLNSQIDIVNGLHTIPSSSSINLENNIISINRKFTGLNTLYMIEPAIFNTTDRNIHIDDTGITIRQNIGLYSALRTLNVYTDIDFPDIVSDLNEKIIKICNKIIYKFKELDHKIDSYSLNMSSISTNVIFKINTRTKHGINTHSVCSFSYEDVDLYDDIEWYTKKLDGLHRNNNIYRLSEKENDMLVCVPINFCADNNIYEILCNYDTFEVCAKNHRDDNDSINNEHALVLCRKVKEDETES